MPPCLPRQGRKNEARLLRAPPASGIFDIDFRKGDRMKGPIFLFAIMLSLAGAVGSQSPSDLGRKYHTVVFFEIRPGVVMTPKFTAGGEVCQMTVQKLAETQDGNLADNFFTEPEISDLVDNLAPPSERGIEIPEGAISGHGWQGYMSGGMIEHITTYENAFVAAVGRSQPKPPARMTLLVITWRKRVCQTPSQ
jgi:hypothetical protein